jgi:hypothetical protein
MEITPQSDTILIRNTMKTEVSFGQEFTAFSFSSSLLTYHDMNYMENTANNTSSSVSSVFVTVGSCFVTITASSGSTILAFRHWEGGRQDTQNQQGDLISLL